MLKRLFTSNTRIKLLTTFLSNPDEEYFIRELTRKLEEQINSIRRELDNLKRAGFLKAKLRNRKKFYCVNKDYIFYEELRSMVAKALSTSENISKKIAEMGDIKLLVLTGLFLDQPTKTVDMLIVGDVDREKFQAFLANELHTRRPVKFTLMSEADYSYRRNLNDQFLTQTVDDQTAQVLIKKI